ncbi:MAG: sugar-binding domain-containing protein [Lachnospiraceae bacterium]
MTAGGIGWYKKTLNIEEKKKGKRYLLYFGGVYENAVLWVNGMKIGSHKYGYSSFKMDITDAVQSGDNELLMRVDNSVSPADRGIADAEFTAT